MKRLVIVADNPLIVGAIRSGLREQDAIQLLGYLDPQNATAHRIVHADADVVLVDEAERPEAPIALMESLKRVRPDITVIILTVQLDADWLLRAFEAGADGAMSKAMHPSALATLIQETVRGHIVHSLASIFRPIRAADKSSTDHSLLTDRELEILQLVASGATNSDIARDLWITRQTVKFHVSNIYRKLDVANRTQACHYAHANGLVAPAEPVSATSTEAPAIAS
jgi:DNA-binding NarL/FixJ family response regulator